MDLLQDSQLAELEWYKFKHDGLSDICMIELVNGGLSHEQELCNQCMFHVFYDVISLVKKLTEVEQGREGEDDRREDEEMTFPPMLWHNLGKDSARQRKMAFT